MACNSEKLINWNLCILCQVNDSRKGPLVGKPKIDSFQHLLQTVQDRASLCDGIYVEVQNRLQDYTKETLQMQKAIWHRSCYSNATNKDQMERAKNRYNNELLTGSCSQKKHEPQIEPTETYDSVPGTSLSLMPFTRSCTVPFNKMHCFFCQEEDDQKLFRVRTENAGKNLRNAVEISKNAILKTRLNTGISPTDAHAIDVMYHKQCWTTGVSHILRRGNQKCDTRKNNTFQTACFIELINFIDLKTKQKAVLSMEDIETTYFNMLGTDGLETHFPAYTRHWLKDKILTELPHLKSVLQKNRRKAAVLYNPAALEEELIYSAVTKNYDDMDNMKNIYETAKRIRKCIDKFTPEVSTDILSVSSSIRDVPVELYTLIRWIIAGSMKELQTEKRTNVIDQTAITLSQNIMYAIKSDRQVSYKPSNCSQTFRHTTAKENSQVRGLALTVHHQTRNKKMVDLLSAQGYCVSYTRTLLLETAIANAVVENTSNFHGLYVPPCLKKGLFLFFATDNTDFAEDTADGKNNIHGTITVVYQKTKTLDFAEPIAPPLNIVNAQSLTVAPYHVNMMTCGKPKRQPNVKRNNDFIVNKMGIPESYQNSQLGWVVASSLSRINGHLGKIPGWAGYHSLLSEKKSITQVGAFPLLPEVAHEWSTLLTVMNQANQLRRLAVGENHPTVISFDLALYEKAVQLIDARPELKCSIFPRLGELHVVMAALRALGASMENSGIDDAWVEADVYGPATTRQILGCTHYKRSLRAHIYSYSALYEILLEDFFKDNPQMNDVCVEATSTVEAACAQLDKNAKAKYVKESSAKLLEVLSNAEFFKNFQNWKETKSKNAMFKSLLNYIYRVETILFFVAASRNADLSLHLQAGEALSKLFFAMDRIKYKRLWPRYISDMYDLKMNYPQTWRELGEGNISVTKSDIPFVSIGADHACEHLNRIMKVHNGLLGISNNGNARQRFFMSLPLLSNMATEFNNQFEIENSGIVEHHDLGQSAIRIENNTVSKIKSAILRHGNPFRVQGDRIYNLISHAYIPDEFVPQILNIDITGQKLYEDYVSQRINGSVSLWEPLKKEKNKMYKSANLKTAVKVRDSKVDLVETKDLYGRLMVLARSNRDIDQKYAIGNYEFTITPRALFAPDGSLLQCADKSKLIVLLEKLGVSDSAEDDSSAQLQTIVPTNECLYSCRRIALVDGMVLLQKLTKKPATLMTVKDLCEYYNDKLMFLTREFHEIIVVFDTYTPDSLKSTTRHKRRKGKDPVQYNIKDDTKINSIPLSRFLSHESTKSDLTKYFARRIIEYSKESSKLVIVSAAGETKSNKGILCDENNHEEADTLLIQQAVLAAQRNPPDSQLVFFSPDTDVLVLAIANYDALPRKSSISMVSGNVLIEPIWNALGEKKAKALLSFHAFSGSDTTGIFCGLGKATWLKAFLSASEDIIEALVELSKAKDIRDEVFSTLAEFVCTAYAPKLMIKSIPELRWHLFCKKMAESHKLPPTLGALKQHILRAHIQARVWGQATIAQQEFINPDQHGFYKNSEGTIMAITTEDPPAPKAIIEMVRCHCTKKTNCSSYKCSCRSKNLSCTELCQCSEECDNHEDLMDIIPFPENDDDL